MNEKGRARERGKAIRTVPDAPMPDPLFQRARTAELKAQELFVELLNVYTVIDRFIRADERLANAKGDEEKAASLAYRKAWDALRRIRRAA